MKTFNPIIATVIAASLFMAFSSSSMASPDSSRFQVANDGNVDAYFAGGSAGYTNIGAAYFGNASNSIFINGSTSTFGQHFDYGIQYAGASVSFLDLVLDTGDFWYSDQSRNSDGLNHIFHSSFTLPDGTPALFVSFEDMRGLGDKDMNDFQMVFTNVSAVPEPETYMMMIIGLGLLLMVRNFENNR